MSKLLKSLFTIVPLIWLTILVWLAFFQHPCADDFTVHFFSENYGMREGMKYFFAHGTGRYCSVPLLFLLQSSHFLFDHYYVGVILLMVVMYVSLYVFISYFAGAFYQVSFSASRKCWLAAFAMLLITATIPEPGSFFYWVGTGVVYLLSFAAFLFYLMLLHKRYVKNDKSIGNTLLLLLVIVLQCGFNEIAMYYSLAVFSLLLFYRFFFLKEKKAGDIIILFVHIGLVLMVFFTPGNHERSAGYGAKQMALYSMVSAFYQVIQVFGAIFSSSFFWVAWLAIWIFAPRLKPETVALFRSWSPRIALLLLFVAMLVLAFGVRHAAGQMIPPRGKNIMVCIAMMGLLFITMLYACRLEIPAMLYDIIIKRPAFFYFFGVALFVFNPFTKKIVQSMINAPVHKELLDHRIAQIEKAKKAGKRKVVFNNYNEEIFRWQQMKWSPKAAAFVKVELPAPPPLLFFINEPEGDYAPYYAEYYKIDSLQAGNVRAVRVGLTWDYSLK